MIRSEWEKLEPLKPEEYYDHFRDIFSKTCRGTLKARSSIGVSLTGGLDTRIIMAWRNPAPNTMPCYTFGSMYRDNEDVKLARRVAKICGQQHETIPTGERVPFAIRSLCRTDDLSHRRYGGY